jgi:hypothetical protein
MKLSVGTKVRWESAAGVKRGTIAEIVLDKNGADEIVPWITIEQDHGRVASHHRQNYMVHFCATDSNLKMMRVAQVL